MNKQQLINKTKAHLKAELAGEWTGHDWWHVERVLNNAMAIAKKEKGADSFIVQFGALLHDIADFKFHGGDDTIGGKVAAQWLIKIGADVDTISRVVHIVDNVSFKGLGEKSKMKSLEGKIVQDADRLDAIGALGIARAFAYGGYKERPIYDPGAANKVNKKFSAYKKGSDSSIHHFYEKLLHVKDLMNTKAGKKMAMQRHKFLELYLKEFYAEWEVKR
jgi:uncharacterized protein